MQRKIGAIVLNDSLTIEFQNPVLFHGNDHHGGIIWDYDYSNEEEVFQKDIPSDAVMPYKSMGIQGCGWCGFSTVETGC